MRIPVVKGTIKRRLLVNFRAAPEVVQRNLPAPFRPKLHQGHALVGICLIRLENVRPVGLPSVLGLSSENAAHRIAVEWNDKDGTLREGVYIPRRDTGSMLTYMAGGRIFPGEHHYAQFNVNDDGTQIDFLMESADRNVKVRVVGKQSDHLPATSCFKSITDASAFFEGGSVGYSVKRDVTRLDALRLRTLEWRVEALDVTTAYSSYFARRTQFPEGSIHFDHALIMRNLQHEWHHEEEMMQGPGTASIG